MEIKEITVKLGAFVLITGLNSYMLYYPDEQYMTAKEYYKTICPNYLSCVYLGYSRFKIKYMGE